MGLRDPALQIWNA